MNWQVVTVLYSDPQECSPRCHYLFGFKINYNINHMLASKSLSVLSPQATDQNFVKIHSVTIQYKSNSPQFDHLNHICREVKFIILLVAQFSYHLSEGKREYYSTPYMVSTISQTYENPH
jgi:hypothetical protein